jgi:hypothetical protein
MKYKGWTITFNENRPVTGTWRAERFGVGMCASSLESLQHMIDIRVREGWNA